MLREPAEGEWWYIWGTKRQVLERRTRPERREVFADGRMEVWCLLSPMPHRGRFHWTDWIRDEYLTRRGDYLPEGEETELPDAPPPPSRDEIVEAAVEAARAAPVGSPMTQHKRLKNRINSLRSRIRNPEKNGRPKWEAHEIREMEQRMAQAQAELDALKEES